MYTVHLTFVFQVYFKTCFTKCQASIRFFNIYTVSVFINKITVNLYKCNNIIGTTDTYWVQYFCRKYENTLCLPGLSATRVDSRLVGDFTTIQNTFSYLSDNILFCLRCTAKLNSTDKHTVCIYVCTECVCVCLIETEQFLILFITHSQVIYWEGELYLLCSKIMQK